MKYIPGAMLNDQSEMIGYFLWCHVCNTDKRVQRTSVTDLRSDPTEVYHLQCGHTVI